MNLESYFLLFLGLQLVHSLEEVLTGFYKKFPSLRMTQKFFVTFEVCFMLFWVFVYLFKQFPIRDHLLAFFIALMFANGLWHIIWFWFFEKAKKYVPGLITAPFFIVLFFIFYYSLIF